MVIYLDGFTHDAILRLKILCNRNKLKHWYVAHVDMLSTAALRVWHREGQCSCTPSAGVHMRGRPNLYILIQTSTLLVAKYLFTHSHWQGDVNGKGQPPPGANQSACTQRSKTAFMWDRLGVCVCVPVCEVQFLWLMFVCVCEDGLSVQMATSVIVLIKPSQTRRNKIKGKLMLNTGWDFSPSLCLSNLVTLPRLHDAQNRHVEVIPESYVEKFLMCMKWPWQREGKKERVTEREWAACWMGEVCILYCYCNWCWVCKRDKRWSWLKETFDIFGNTLHIFAKSWVRR